MSEKITLSVVMITYNHEKYLRRAIDSILMQKVDFKYEIIVGEDNSPDNSRAILLEYKEKYPDIFNLRLHDENLGPSKNYFDAKLQCQGEFIACLEGDDFWICENKLQKQVDILRKNKSASACVHRCTFVDDDNNPVPTKKDNDSFFNGDIYSINDFSTGVFPGQTATLVYRNFYKDNLHDYTIMTKAHSFVSDRTLIMILVLSGDIICLSEVMSAYRISVSSAVSRVNLRYNAVEYFQSLESWAYNEYGVKNILYPAKRELLRATFSQIIFGKSKIAKENFKFLFAPCNDKFKIIMYLISWIIVLPFKKIFAKIKK